MSVLAILFAISLSLLVISGVVIAVLAKRLLQHDSFLQFLVDDLDDSSEFFKKLVTSDLLSNSPEVLSAHEKFKQILAMMQRYSEAIRDRGLREIATMEKPKKAKAPVFLD